VTFSVLFVCTGNICRSPMAERLFRLRVADFEISTASAGVAGLVGHPMDATSATVLRELGGEPIGHVARRLEPALIQHADLLLTADLSHRSAIMQTEPLSFMRTFTLREFGRLGADLPPLRGPVSDDLLRDRVREVSSRRGQAEPVAAREDAIADPFSAPISLVRTVGQQISVAVDGVVRALGLPS